MFQCCCCLVSTCPNMLAFCSFKKIAGKMNIFLPTTCMSNMQACIRGVRRVRMNPLLDRDESILLFSPPIFLSSNSFCSDLFCSKDPNFAHIFPSSQTFVPAFLEYLVKGVCPIGEYLSLVTVLLEYLDLYNDNKLL